MIIPISVTNGQIEYTLYAIWANNPSDPNGQYIEQVWKAINYYDNFLTNKKTILIGDFNSNTILDKKNREGNHSNVVKRLEEKKIFSSYHLFHKQIQGKEQHPTLYLYRHKDKPYHIDYCFISKDLANKLENVEIGEFEY
jgi:exonuclease III